VILLKYRFSVSLDDYDEDDDDIDDDDINECATASVWQCHVFQDSMERMGPAGHS